MAGAKDPVETGRGTIGGVFGRPETEGSEEPITTEGTETAIPDRQTLESMTRSELEQVAQDHDVQVSSSMTKADMVDALDNAR